MNLMDIAAKLLGDRLGVDAGAASKGLEGLMGDGAGGVQLASLVDMFRGGGFADVVSSWLGDGANLSIDADAVRNAFGGEKLAQAAGAAGVDADALAGGLSDVIPQLIDKASSGGELLSSLGGVEGVAALAKRFF